MLVNCAAYQSGKKLGDIRKDEIHDYLSRAGCFVWVALKDPTPEELAEMQQQFGLHELAVEDAHHGHQRPKIEEYGDSLFAVLHTIERAAAMRARHGDSPLTLRAAMLVMKPNVGEVFAFIRRMADLGVELISLDTPKGDAFKALRSDSPAEMEKIFEQVTRGFASLAGTRAQLDGPLLSELHEWLRRSGRSDELPRWGYDECAQLRPASPRSRMTSSRAAGRGKAASWPPPTALRSRLTRRPRARRRRRHARCCAWQRPTAGGSITRSA